MLNIHSLHSPVISDTLQIHSYPDWAEQLNRYRRESSPTSPGRRRSPPSSSTPPRRSSPCLRITRARSSRGGKLRITGEANHLARWAIRRYTFTLLYYALFVLSCCKSISIPDLARNLNILNIACKISWKILGKHQDINISVCSLYEFRILRSNPVISLSHARLTASEKFYSRKGHVVISLI